MRFPSLSARCEATGAWKKMKSVTHMSSSTNLHAHDEAWKGAIKDAELEIDKARQRIRRLQESIRVFRKKLNNGEPCPSKNRAAVTRSNKKITQRHGKQRATITLTDLFMEIIRPPRYNRTGMIWLPNWDEPAFRS